MKELLPQDIAALKQLLKEESPSFWKVFFEKAQGATEFKDLVLLSSLRKRALTGALKDTITYPKKKIALIGAYTFHPLADFIEHFAFLGGVNAQLFQGEFDSYTAEVFDEESELYKFKPEMVVLIPSALRCKSTASLLDPAEVHREAGRALVEELMGLCNHLNKNLGCEVVLANFPLSSDSDLGGYRSKTLGSDWAFRKFVNLEIGLQSPPFVNICDLEFLSGQLGAKLSTDEKAWYESKQLGSAEFQIAVGQEIGWVISRFSSPMKKVLVSDLDNTLWGGEIGDLGIEGIELGGLSGRGQAFKDFQNYILSLTRRGVLLAVCSKNNEDAALEPFDSHSEMMIKKDHVSSFKANWDPKSENIKLIAQELGLGLDSFVFIDDNPAEIEIVKQFLPMIETVLLGDDPSLFKRKLQESRHFEPRTITEEDGLRTKQYVEESKREKLKVQFTDMKSYLQSLEMVGKIAKLNENDLTRVEQLINKSNQFNLTTKRRTLVELQRLMNDPTYFCFTTRLADRFGDYGLISVVIVRHEKQTLEIDTLLMSCRVLKRQVEDEIMNSIIDIAQSKGAGEIKGVFIQSKKNSMVSQFYDGFGFKVVDKSVEMANYKLMAKEYERRPTQIKLEKNLELK